MDRINYVILGTGKIAEEHIQGITSLKNANLCGFCSRDYERARDLARRYHVRAYPSFEAVLDDPNVDAVDIITINSLHKEYAIKAARKKKHVIIEKPLALTAKDAQEVIETCKEYNVKLSVISNYRTSRFFQAIEEKINKGEWGEISLVTATIKKNRPASYFQGSSSWRAKKEEAGGGVLIMNAIHVLDLFLHLFGEPKAVHMFADKPGIEDTASISLKFKKNILCNIHVTRKANINYKDCIEIYGSKASLAVSEDKVRFYTQTDDTIKAHAISTMRKIQRPHLGSIKDQIKDFTEAIIQNRDPVVTGEDGLRALKVIEKLYRERADE